MEPPTNARKQLGVIAAGIVALGVASFAIILPRVVADDEETTLAGDVVPVAGEALDPGSATPPEPAAPSTTATTTTTMTSSTTDSSITTTTTPPSGEWPPQPSPFDIAPPPGEDAELTLAVSVEPGEEEQAGLPGSGNDVTVTLQVTNSGSEFLWGVYAYMEGSGPMTCTTPRLAAGETALCTATTSGEPGEHTAWLWATAWTTTSILGTDVTHSYVIDG